MTEKKTVELSDEVSALYLFPKIEIGKLQLLERFLSKALNVSFERTLMPPDETPEGENDGSE